MGFRWFVREAAQRLGIRGWVRNLADGTVEGRAAGEPAAMDAFENALRSGPAFAQVSAVETKDMEPSTVPGGFEIRH